jgi:hypothetical protein
VAVRGIAFEALALHPPAPDRGHVGLDPGLIDEDQPLGIEMRLQALPALPLPRDGGARLLKGEQGFF